MLLVVSVILLCAVTAAWPWLKKRPNAPPELPGALPIIGHSLQLLGDRKYLWNVLRRMQITAAEKDGVIEAWVFNHSFYVITDPEDSLTVANSCYNKPYIYDFTKELLNNGLLTSEVSVWKSHRKLLNPSFSQRVLNTYVNEMNVQARSLVSRLASKVGKDPFDVRKFFISYTVTTVTRTSLGLNTQDQTTFDTDYAEGIEVLAALVCDRLQKVWYHLSFIFDLSAMKRKQTKHVNKLKNMIYPIIYGRKSELKANNDRNMYDDSTSGKCKPVLDQMLHLAEEQDAFTDSDIREHLDTFVAAAYDTTSTTLTFLLLVIGSDRDIQERIFNDDEVVGFAFLRHPMWGPDADQFRPERWLNSATLPHHPSLNAAFGVGKRNCIGKVYGMMSMKVALAHILRRYRVIGDINKVVCEYDIILKPVEGYLISLSQRK